MSTSEWSAINPLSARESVIIVAIQSIRLYARATLTAAVLLFGPAPAYADQTDERLEELFNSLGETEDLFEAQEVQLQISNIWQDSNSASIELLLSRSISAINEQDYDTARTHLDDIVDLAPEFAEGWNQRAILNFVTYRYEEAILDIQKTVLLEPRHYGAWSGLGQIFESVGNERAALEAYRHALSLNPYLEGTERAIKSLERDVEGRGI